MQQDLIEVLALEELNISPDALSQWRRRGRVPHRHRLALLAAAARRGLVLDVASFDQFVKLRTRRGPWPDKGSTLSLADNLSLGRSRYAVCE